MTISTNVIFSGSISFITLKITFNDDDIDKFQNILTNQFWKLNESESNPEGKLEEAMTVHLTDESKTVGGKEPNNERYTFIKDSLFEQIDSEDYESWQDKVFRHFDQLNKDKINEHLESIDEDMLYNIAYIRKAPKSTKHHDLSDVIKIAYFEKISQKNW